MASTDNTSTLISYLNDIGAAIRTKTGDAAGTKYYLKDMASKIESIETGEGTGVEQVVLPRNYEDYTRKEALRVANEIRNSGVLKDESIVSICMSDSHYYANTGDGIAGKKAIEGIKALTYLLPVDFIAHLGDLGAEDSIDTDGTVTLEELQANTDEMLKFLQEAAGGIPLFVAIGNHDPGSYIDKDNDTSDQVQGIELYNKFTSLINPESNAVSGQEYGGYCYKDFPEKSLRVYLLNTAEGIIRGGHEYDSGASSIQREWFADSLISMNNDDTTKDWSFIVLCHYPADYGASLPLANILKAYADGNSAYKDSQITTPFDFSKNSAKFLVQIHGHIHNFLIDKICYGSTISSSVNGVHQEQSSLNRICVPNTQAIKDRHNHNVAWDVYDEAGNLVTETVDGYKWGIKFFEGNFVDSGKADLYYYKTLTNEESTSFIVNIINPSDNLIYSFTYGAGPEKTREIYIGEGELFEILWNVYANDDHENTIDYQKPLDVAVVSKPITGGTFIATVTEKDGWVIDSISVTMDGIPQNSAWDKVAGTITVEKVSADIEITVYATTNIYEVSGSFDNDKIEIVGQTEFIHGDKCEITLVPEPGYDVEVTSITMGGTAQALSQIYNSKTRTILIEKVTGDIIITGEVYVATYGIDTSNSRNIDSVLYDANGNAMSNAFEGSSITFKVKAKTDEGAMYRLSTVSVTVGGSTPSSDNVSYTYDSTRQYCTVTLKNINGNVLVNAIGQNLLYESVDAQGTAYNSINAIAEEIYAKNADSKYVGTGKYIEPNKLWWRTGGRLSSSITFGNPVAHTSGYFSGYIPFDSNYNLRVYNIDTKTYGGSEPYVLSFDYVGGPGQTGQIVMLSSSSKFDENAIIHDDGSITFTDSAWKDQKGNVAVASREYLRFTCGGITANTIIIQEPKES